jgi:hypothetical protein
MNGLEAGQLLRAAWGSLVALGLLAGGCPLPAQETEQPEQGPQANYAFSTQLGSGIYSYSEGTVQVVRIGVGLTIRTVETHGWGLRLRAPVTFGFYDFKLGDVLESGLPDRVSTLAVVPEVLTEFTAVDNWLIMPFAAVGVGRDFSVGEVNYIVAGGTRSLVTFDLRSVDLYVGNRLLYAGYTTPELEFGDDFAALETGVDVRRPLGFSLKGNEVDVGLFGMNYLYFESPELIRFYGKPVSVDVQWEIGVTFGTTTPWRILGLTVPRLGVSYKAGSSASSVRLVIGGPFT